MCTFENSVDTDEMHVLAIKANDWYFGSIYAYGPEEEPWTTV